MTFKKYSGGPHVSYDEIVEEALAYGWIDSQPRKVDAERSAHLVTIRRPTSSWSALNKLRIERLEAAGLMSPAGIAAVEIARANGAWNALDEIDQLNEPDDLRVEIDLLSDARRYWDAFPRSVKRGILEWIGSARTAPTRAARISETVRCAAKNVRANQWPRRN